MTVRKHLYGSSVRMKERTVSRGKVLSFYIFSPELKNAAKIWARGFAADQKDFLGMRGERGEFGREIAISK